MKPIGGLVNRRGRVWHRIDPVKGVMLYQDGRAFPRSRCGRVLQLVASSAEVFDDPPNCKDCELDDPDGEGACDAIRERVV